MCEDANSKLVDVLTLAEVDAEKRVDDSLSFCFQLFVPIFFLAMRRKSLIISNHNHYAIVSENNHEGKLTLDFLNMRNHPFSLFCKGNMRQFGSIHNDDTHSKSLPNVYLIFLTTLPCFCKYIISLSVPGPSHQSPVA